MIVNIETYIKNNKHYHLYTVKCHKCGKVRTLKFNSIQKEDFINSEHLCRSCSLKGKPKTEEHKLKLSLLKKENHYMRGKTYEEIYGIDKANELKNKRSIKNPGILRRGKTYEEIYGIDKANELKKSMSKRSTGENNNMYGIPSPYNSGNGWNGWYKGHHFRSLLELSFMINYLEKNNIPIISAEKISIPYIEDGKKRTYHPDFKYNNIIFEVKPVSLVSLKNNQNKFKAAKKWCCDNNYEFKIITNDDFNSLTINDVKILYEHKDIDLIQKWKDKLFKIIF